MSDFGWLALAFLLRTLFRPFALELARGWCHLTFRIVSVGVGPEARSLWEDEVLGDLELEIWDGLKDPKLSRQDIAVRLLRRSVDLLWNGWTERGAYLADAARVRAALGTVEVRAAIGAAATKHGPLAQLVDLLGVPPREAILASPAVVAFGLVTPWLAARLPLPVAAVFAVAEVMNAVALVLLALGLAALRRRRRAS